MQRDSLRRDNHYVPRGYLKRWETAPGQIWTYRVLVSHADVPLWTKKALRGVAYHEHLYTRLAAGIETDDIERWLESEFETPAEDALDRAVNDRKLTPEHWRRLIRFFAAQDVRTPARFLENLARWSTTVPALVQDVIKESMARYEKMSDTERALAMTKSKDPYPMPLRVSIERNANAAGGQLKAETVIGRGLWVSSIRHLLTDTLNVLYQHRWTILAPPEGQHWITTDDPALKLNFNTVDEYDFKGGWGKRGTDLVLPLGPQHLLFAEVGKHVPRRGCRMEREKASLLTRLMAEHAHRFIFAREPDATVVKLRPRVVDAQALRSENEAWKRWHSEQSKAERDLMGWPN